MALGAERALSARGAERSGGGEGGGRGGLLDVGGCWKTCHPPLPPPTEGVSKQRACFETVSKHPPQEQLPTTQE